MRLVRLFIEEPLGEGQSVTLPRDQAHYLFAVMRLVQGSELRVFDGVTGEYVANVTVAGKRGGELAIGALTAPLKVPPDLWLLFAPIKKERTDFIVEKAAEMGVRRILPVSTEFTNASRINLTRLRAHAVEAAEQCGGTFVPAVDDLQSLDHLLANWSAERRLMFCDETLLSAKPSLNHQPGPWAILIGPEGGFSESERTKLRGFNFAYPVSLGPRVLRADTAAVAALTLWQMSLGDWR